MKTLVLNLFSPYQKKLKPNIALDFDVEAGWSSGVALE